jgi:hypothetical protein
MKTARKSNGGITERKPMELLSIDPGSNSMGMIDVRWNGKDPRDEKNFSFPWMCLANLNNGGDDGIAEDVEGDEIDKGLEIQAKRLNRFLSGNESLNAIFDDADDRGSEVTVLVEQVEGAMDIRVMARLVRIGFVVGCAYRYFKSEKRSPVKFLPKIYKRGWDDIKNAAAKTVERKLASGKIEKPATNARRQNAIKTQRKNLVTEWARRTIEKSDTPERVKRLARKCPTIRFNHIADALSQALRYCDEKYAETTGVPYVDHLSPETMRELEIKK